MDLISRQDAIDCFWDENRMMRDWLDIVKDIRSLPSAQKKGEWINNVNGTFECSICGWKHSRNNFCPNCGARMLRGEEKLC